MKRFYLPAATRAALLELVGRRAVGIAADEWEVRIRFDEAVVTAVLKDQNAASQNPYDEVIYAEVSVGDADTPASGELPPDQAGGELTGILVVDTIVYFTDHKDYGPSDQVSAQARRLFSQIRATLAPGAPNRLRATVDQLLVEATGGHEELTASPTSKEWHEADERYVNHVETGVVFQFGEQCVPAFTPDNSFAMVCTRDRPLLPVAEVLDRYSDSCRFRTLLSSPEGLA